MRSEDGTVQRQTVIKVLENNGVIVTDQKDSFDDMKVLTKGDIVEARRLPEYAHKKLLHHLARVFGVPIHLFYD